MSRFSAEYYYTSFVTSPGGVNWRPYNERNELMKTLLKTHLFFGCITVLLCSGITAALRYVSGANGDRTVNVLELVLVAQDLGESTGTQKPVTPPPPAGMALIPAGEFQMGSNDAESDNDEQPVHTVYVDAFYMDETEVTNAQFKEFLIENPRWQKGRIDSRFASTSYLYFWSGNNYPSGMGNHPVDSVSWYAAMAYADWAGKRLPTEAEWERAARGGLVGNKYPHGNTLTARDANYGKNVKDTTAVGRYPVNAYGLYDMAGNVWEWCLDEYDADFYFTLPRHGVARNPLSGANSVKWLLDNFTNIKSSRVLRGGSWGNTERTVRVANRVSDAPTDSYNGNGFRCARIP